MIHTRLNARSGNFTPLVRIIAYRQATVLASTSDP